jgi:argininosuccinate synthase
MIDDSQRERSTAIVRLKLYKGNRDCHRRSSKSDNSLFDTAHFATFEDDGGAYNQKPMQKASSSSMPCVCVLRPTMVANC